jgi:DNA-directed RNA polymerase subunit F
MSNIEIINEMSITMAELKDRLDDIKKRDKELNSRAVETEEYLHKFVSIKAKEAVKLREEINKLQIPRLKDRQINKIIDVMPKDVESLKLIFVGDNLTLKQEDLEKIINILK